MSPDLDSLALLRLFQLASPSLPVGAYAYSQGLEWAVESGWVSDEDSLTQWISEQLVHSIGGVDLPVLARLHRAAAAGDDDSMVDWSRRLIAMRETRELVADDCDRGHALARLLRDLGVAGAEAWVERDVAPFASLTAVAAAQWKLAAKPTLNAYAFAWLENQALVGVKIVPLGQVAGQRTILKLAPLIPDLCERALECEDDEIGGTLLTVALCSSLHETQYTRLYRS